AFAMGMLSIPRRDFGTATNQVAGLFQISPDSLDAVISYFLPVMGRVGLALATIKISFPDSFWRQSEAARHPSDYILDNHHALRSAEAAESGVGGDIGPGHLTTKLNRRNVIGVIKMKEGAVGDSLRQVHRPTAVGSQVHSRREQTALGI